jgi:hypothetical protein
VYLSPRLPRISLVFGRHVAANYSEDWLID